MSFLKADHVSKIYKTGGNQFCTRRTIAVDDVSFEMCRGECLAIVGESGSGKSTLGRVVVGLETPTKGAVFFEDKNVQVRMGRERRRALQMVFQNSYDASNPRFTARDVVEEPLRYFHLVPKKELHERADVLLETVGIDRTEGGKITAQLSGGQLQRVCIARAIAAQPKLILLDEPLSSLDVSVQAQILNLLRDLREQYGLSYLLISHDLEVVYNLSDRLLVMYFGQIVEEISDMNLFGSLCHPYTVDLLEASKYESDHDRTHDGAMPEKGCVYAPLCGCAVQQCREQRPRLCEFEEGHKIACHLVGKRVEV